MILRLPGQWSLQFSMATACISGYGNIIENCRKVREAVDDYITFRTTTVPVAQNAMKMDFPTGRTIVFSALT